MSVRLSKKNTPAGTVWRFRYRTAEGTTKIKAVPVDIPGKAQAEVWATDWLRRSRQGAQVGGARTLRSLAPTWLATLDPEVRQLRSNTLERYVFSHPIADIDLEAPLTVPDCVAWIEWLRQQPSPKAKRPLAPLTVRNLIQTLRDYIVDARGRGWVPGLHENPLADSYIKKVFRKPERLSGDDHVVLNDAQARGLLHRDVDSRTVRYALGILAGLRLSEIQGLSWAHLHLDDAHPRVYVERQLKRVTDGVPAFKAPKRNSKRWVPLHPHLRALLVGFKPAGAKPEDPVLPDDSGRWHRNVPTGKVREDLSMLGFKPVDDNGHSIDFHSTRRTFATALSDAGVPDAVLKALMGHAAGNVTDKSYVARDHKRYAPWVDKIFQERAAVQLVAAE